MANERSSTVELRVYFTESTPPPHVAYMAYETECVIHSACAVDMAEELLEGVITTLIRQTRDLKEGIL